MTHRDPEDVIRHEADLTAALSRLRTLDPAVIEPLVALVGRPPLRARPFGLESLIWIVLSQQVSTASAQAIFNRVALRFPGVDPAAVLDGGEPALRLCGLSRPKIRTVLALCTAVIDGTLSFEALAGQNTETARRTLVGLHGIGPWTAEIVLLSCLGHPDAWPAGDLALQEAARVALKLDKRPTTAEMETLGERWRPYRAVAARLLWAAYAAVKAGPQPARQTGRKRSPRDPPCR